MMSTPVRNTIIVVVTLVCATLLGIGIFYFTRPHIPSDYIKASACPLSCKAGQTYADTEHTMCCPAIAGCDPGFYYTHDNVKGTKICDCQQCGPGYKHQDGTCVVGELR